MPRARVLMLCAAVSLAALAPPGGARPPGSPVDAQAFLDAHNRARARHGVPPLTWSPRLADSARAWAGALRDRGCQMAHSRGPHGENLAAGTAGTLDEAAVVAMWYGEVEQYSFRDGGFSMRTGHFTQVVWRGTRELGCARTACSGLDLWVCQYDPPGNVRGQFLENVPPPRGPGAR